MHLPKSKTQTNKNNKKVKQLEIIDIKNRNQMGCDSLFYEEMLLRLCSAIFASLIYERGSHPKHQQKNTNLAKSIEELFAIKEKQAGKSLLFCQNKKARH